MFNNTKKPLTSQRTAAYVNGPDPAPAPRWGPYIVPTIVAVLSLLGTIIWATYFIVDQRNSLLIKIEEEHNHLLAHIQDDKNTLGAQVNYLISNDREFAYIISNLTTVMLNNTQKRWNRQDMQFWCVKTKQENEAVGSKFVCADPAEIQTEDVHTLTDLINTQRERLRILQQSQQNPPYHSFNSHPFQNQVDNQPPYNSGG